MFFNPHSIMDIYWCSQFRPLYLSFIVVDRTSDIPDSFGKFVLLIVLTVNSIHAETVVFPRILTNVSHMRVELNKNDTTDKADSRRALMISLNFKLSVPSAIHGTHNILSQYRIIWGVDLSSIATFNST